jgi:hypothetical protein
MKDYIIAAMSIAGIVVTALFGVLANRQKFREDLQAKYDSNIHDQRTQYYALLWKKLDVLAKFAPPAAVTARRLDELSKTLREWFFDTGGLYLSDHSRQAYLDLQTAMVECVQEQKIPDQEISGDSLKQIQDKATALRAYLSKDIGSRKQ